MKTLSVLLIEDDMIETMKFNRVLNSLELKHKVTEATNGEEALKILKDKNRIPDLILLDLNMPKMNGKELLKILKDDPVLRYIPAIILSTSNNHQDIKECYEIGVAGYIMKPLKYEEYTQKIKNLLSYWSVSELIKG
ncbi:response regulator [Aquimarina sp. RZ0]|uniref:response regulator n=1 Tax=Aquimarina sp. RZ0 TaxID=2607730 RepID=UPI0011F38F22|nr:response regulator [Aquimarina sp. RZ0]KAA1243308.1 response regulator [Aquimarina sp. RZ0]